MNFGIHAMKTCNRSIKSRGNNSEKSCCVPQAEGQPINEASEQQLPPCPELLLDDFAVNEEEECYKEEAVQPRGNQSLPSSAAASYHQTNHR